MTAESPRSLYGTDTRQPDDRLDREPRCVGCGKLLARFVTRPWRIDCPRCKVINSKAR